MNKNIISGEVAGSAAGVWARAGLGPSPGWGPVRVGAHMGPYGSSWTGLGRLRKLSVRLVDQFRTFRIQN